MPQQKTTKKPSILFLCVNYHSYPELDDYLDSINRAALSFKNPLSVDVKVADNSVENRQPVDVSRYNSIHIEVSPYHKNLGYMGAISRLIQDAGPEKVKTYDFVIVSNVDLLLSESFFTGLLALETDANTGWIAPQIFSQAEKRDRNPKISKRPSANRLKMLMLMFKYPLLYRLYTDWVYRFRDKKQSRSAGRLIYAGHGSLMIFTNLFMQQHANFQFPSFLFGEELFFGELARSSGLKVIYAPEIVVHDIDHASTGKINRRAYCRMNYDSLSKLKPLFNQ